jgi:glycosyltransferase involved in cell wall biosynthesis
MRVVHLSTHEQAGGAARAAHGLHAALRAAGVDSRMLVLERQTDDPAVEVVARDPVDEGAWSLIDARWTTGNRTTVSNTMFSSGGLGAALATHPAVAGADAVNIHWVAGLASIDSIGAVLALGKPVVWTLHDEWAYTGGCHYTTGCDAWRTACARCPQLAEDPHGLVGWQFGAKRASYALGALTVVTPSRWLATRAAESALLSGRRVETIPYGVDLEVFAPSRRAAGRRRLGLGDHEAAVLFSADAAGERRKGFAELLQALAGLEGRVSTAPRLVVLGDAGQVALPADAIATGRLADRVALAEVVAGCDLYVLPSLEDNLPNGVLEAMAAGTACVAFDAGGVPDMLAEAPACAMAPVGDVAALAAEIARSLGRLGELRAARAALSDFARTRYAPERQAARYRALYEDLVGRA